MLKSIKQAFTGTPEQTYLAERLQSAKWLGWEMETPAAAPRKSADAASSENLVGTPAASGKPA
jgi:hypothetical protein